MRMERLWIWKTVLLLFGLTRAPSLGEEKVLATGPGGDERQLKPRNARDLLPMLFSDRERVETRLIDAGGNTAEGNAWNAVILDHVTEKHDALVAALVEGVNGQVTRQNGTEILMALSRNLGFFEKKSTINSTLSLSTSHVDNDSDAQTDIEGSGSQTDEKELTNRLIRQIMSLLWSTGKMDDDVDVDISPSGADGAGKSSESGTGNGSREHADVEVSENNTAGDNPLSVRTGDFDFRDFLKRVLQDRSGDETGKRVLERNNTTNLSHTIFDGGFVKTQHDSDNNRSGNLAINENINYNMDIVDDHNISDKNNDDNDADDDDDDDDDDNNDNNDVDGHEIFPSNYQAKPSAGEAFSRPHSGESSSPSYFQPIGDRDIDSTLSQIITSNDPNYLNDDVSDKYADGTGEGDLSGLVDDCESGKSVGCNSSFKEDIVHPASDNGSENKRHNSHDIPLSDNFAYDQEPVNDYFLKLENENEMVDDETMDIFSKDNDYLDVERDHQTPVVVDDRHYVHDSDNDNDKFLLWFLQSLIRRVKDEYEKRQDPVDKVIQKYLTSGKRIDKSSVRPTLADGAIQRRDFETVSSKFDWHHAGEDPGSKLEKIIREKDLERRRHVRDLIARLKKRSMVAASRGLI